MEANCLQGAARLGASLLVLIPVFAGSSLGELVGAHSSVFSQVLAAALVAQIAAAAFFAAGAQQPGICEESTDVLPSSAVSLAVAAMPTILGLGLLIVFLAADAPGDSPEVRRSGICRFAHALSSRLAVLAAFVVVAHSPMTLPTAVIGPLTWACRPRVPTGRPVAASRTCRTNTRHPHSTVVRMSGTREPLDPEAALALLRSHRWHPDTVAACLVHVSDWLSGTGQHGPAGELRSIWVTAPDGTQTTVAKLIGSERSAARRIERARKQARRNAMLEQWRASHSRPP